VIKQLTNNDDSDGAVAGEDCDNGDNVTIYRGSILW